MVVSLRSDRPSPVWAWWAFAVLFLAGWTTFESRAATISGFAPDRGPTGTEVTITGTGLQTASAVLFGASDAMGEILSRSANSVRVRVPWNALTGQVSVYTTGSGTATSPWLFYAAPRISEIEPLRGGPGMEVRVTGFNFGGSGGRGQVTDVTFDGQMASFRVVALNQLIAVVPTNASTGPIRVANEAGSFTTLDPFHVTALLTGFNPLGGMPGDTVEIRGRNLAFAQQVAFGAALARFTAVSASNLVAFVPTNAVNGALQVTTPAGIAVTASNFVVRPRILSFTPVFGPVGTSVTLEGGGFHGLTEVQFNGVKAAVTPQSSTRLTAVVPAGASTGPLKLVTTNGSFTTESFFHLPARITSVTPGSGKRGDTITIDGVNLNGSTRVRFNGVEAEFTIVSANRLTAIVPALATTGRLSIETPGGTELSPGTFAIAPILDGFSPGNGAVGTPVQLAGSGLTNLTWVRLGDLDTTFTVLNSTHVRVIVPLNAFSGPFRLRNASGQEAATTSPFLVDGARPTLASFTPTQGPVGTPVILDGTGLRTASQVAFNGVAAEFTVTSGSRLETVVPAGASTGLIAVTTLDGIAVSSATFVVPEAPVRLEVERSDGTLVLQWPASATGFVLQSTGHLGPGQVWEAVSTPPVLEGGSWKVALPLPDTGLRYFRLRK